MYVVDETVLVLEVEVSVVRVWLVTVLVADVLVLVVAV